MLRRRYAGRRDVGYAGAEYRVYGFMRVADAVRLYRTLHQTWDEARLAGDLATAGLGPELEIRRMRTVFQRALVLALIAAACPESLVIERAEQFDAAPALALLERVVRRAPQVIATYAPGASVPTGWFDATLPAAEAGAS